MMDYYQGSLQLFGHKLCNILCMMRYAICMMFAGCLLECMFVRRLDLDLAKAPIDTTACSFYGEHNSESDSG